MRLLFRDVDGKYRLKSFEDDDEIPPKVTLSHTWLADKEEPTFKDLIEGTGGEKLGYDKIRLCGQQVKQDGPEYFWVDTCCINKEN
jgi:Heterokaryon incompatibility protein (HET)